MALDAIKATDVGRRGEWKAAREERKAPRTGSAEDLLEGIVTPLDRAVEALDERVPFRPAVSARYRVRIDEDGRRLSVIEGHPARDARAIAMLHGRVVADLLIAGRQAGATPTVEDYIREMAEVGVQVIPYATKSGSPSLMYRVACRAYYASVIALSKEAGAPLSLKGIANAGIDVTGVGALVERSAATYASALADIAPEKSEVAPRHDGMATVLGYLDRQHIPRAEVERNAADALLIIEAAKRGKRIDRRINVPSIGGGDVGDSLHPSPVSVSVLRGTKRRNEFGEYVYPAPTKTYIRRVDGTYDRKEYHLGSGVEIRRVRFEGGLPDLVDATRRWGGIVVVGEPIDPCERALRGERTVLFREDAVGMTIEDDEVRRARHLEVLHDFGRTVVARLRGIPPGLEKYALDHDGVIRTDLAGKSDMSRAYNAARPKGIEDDLADNAMEAVGLKPNMPPDELAYEVSFALRLFSDAHADIVAKAGRIKPGMEPPRVPDWMPDAGDFGARTAQWAGMLPDDKAAAMVGHDPARAKAWLASTRLVALAMEGYELDVQRSRTPDLMRVRRNWFPLDIDGGKIPPVERLHLVPEWRERYPQGLDPYARPEEYARWWREAFLDMDGRAVVQFSSSSGVRKTIDRNGRTTGYEFGNPDRTTATWHLFTELGRQEYPDKVGVLIEAVVKERVAALVEAGVYTRSDGGIKGITGLDPSVLRTVQPIFVTDPKVLGHNGQALTRADGTRIDPLEMIGTPRVLRLDGMPQALPLISEDRLADRIEAADRRLEELGIATVSISSSSGPKQKTTLGEGLHEFTRGPSPYANGEEAARAAAERARMGRIAGQGYDRPLYAVTCAYFRHRFGSDVIGVERKDATVTLTVRDGGLSTNTVDQRTIVNECKEILHKLYEEHHAADKRCGRSESRDADYRNRLLYKATKAFVDVVGSEILREVKIAVATEPTVVPEPVPEVEQTAYRRERRHVRGAFFLPPEVMQPASRPVEPVDIGKPEKPKPRRSAFAVDL